MARTVELWGATEFAEAADEWDALHRLADGCVFQSHAWLRSDTEAGRARVWTVREGRDLIGAFAFGGGWVARPLGVDVSDSLAPLIAPGSGAEVELADALRAWREPVGVELSELPASSALSARLGESEVQSVCPALDLPSEFAVYEALLGKGLRHDLRRQRKRLRVDFAPLEDQTATLEALYRLHSRRWRARGLPGVFGLRRRRHLAKAIANGVEAWTARAWSGDRLIGVLLAFRSGTWVGYYQSGFDPAYASLSPGSVLIAASIARAIEEGCSTFDFLRGDEPYKQRWRPQRREIQHRVFLPAPSWTGTCAQAWSDRVFACGQSVKARFAGRGWLTR